MYISKALVVTYCGKTLTDEQIRKICEIVGKQIASNTKIVARVMSSSDIANIIGAAVLTQKTKCEDPDPVQSACVLIGTTYFEQLKHTSEASRSIAFNCKLSTDVMLAAQNNNNPALVNAVKILSENKPSEELRVKYGLTDDILNIIKFVAISIF